MTNPIIKPILLIKEIKLKVNLGWPRAERLKKQTVIVDVKIQFDEPPVGCITDNLKDTFCYAELVSLLQSSVHHKEFHLVEYLARELYQVIKAKCPEEKIALRITKKPSVLKYLTNGIDFMYGES